MTETSSSVIDRLSTVSVGAFPKPFRFGEFLCATNGHFLIAAPSDLGADRISGKREESITRVLNPGSLPSYSITCGVSLLSTWCNMPACAECKNKRQVSCSECHGTKKIRCVCPCGECAHDIKCDYCDDAGKVNCGCVGVRPGRIGPGCFDRSLVNRILGLISPSGKVTVNVFPALNFAHFLFDDGVKAVLMRMDIDTGPRFKPPKAAS